VLAKASSNSAERQVTSVRGEEARMDISCAEVPISSQLFDYPNIFNVPLPARGGRTTRAWEPDNACDAATMMPLTSPVTFTFTHCSATLSCHSPLSLSLSLLSGIRSIIRRDQ
jgi:hypothetical protein